MLIFSFIICFVLSIFFTFIMMKLAWKLGIVDQPSLRKIHQSAIPSMGGLAIYISFFVGVLLLKPTEPYHQAIMLGGLIILITGMLDDIFELSPI